MGAAMSEAVLDGDEDIQPDTPNWAYFVLIWITVNAIVLPILDIGVNRFNLNDVLGTWVKDLFGYTGLATFFIIPGIMTGFGQWLVLRWYLKSAYRWPIAYFVSRLISAIVFDQLLGSSIVPDTISPDFYFIINIVFNLVIDGISQWIALRYWLPRASLWFVIVAADSLGLLSVFILQTTGFSNIWHIVVTAGGLAYLFQKNWPDMVKRGVVNDIYGEL